MDTHGAKRISSWTTSKGKITKKMKIKLTLKFWTAISLQDGCRISDASKFGTPTSLASTSFSILGLGPPKKTTWDPKKNAAFPHCTSLGFDLALGREMHEKVEDPNAVFTCISSKFQGGPRGVVLWTYVIHQAENGMHHGTSLTGENSPGSGSPERIRWAFPHQPNETLESTKKKILLEIRPPCRTRICPN